MGNGQPHRTLLAAAQRRRARCRLPSSPRLHLPAFGSNAFPNRTQACSMVWFNAFNCMLQNRVILGSIPRCLQRSPGMRPTHTHTHTHTGEVLCPGCQPCSVAPRALALSGGLSLQLLREPKHALCSGPQLGSCAFILLQQTALHSAPRSSSCCCTKQLLKSRPVLPEPSLEALHPRLQLPSLLQWPQRAHVHRFVKHKPAERKQTQSIRSHPRLIHVERFVEHRPAGNTNMGV